jgi:hypothetical protein
MALDFPASPTNGQKYPSSPVAGIPTYTWDGQKWTTTGAGLIGQYVAKSGDTMTGNLNLFNGASLSMDAPAASGIVIGGFKGGIGRWNLQLGTGGGEAGSDAGSDFALYRYHDNGGVIDTPFWIQRSTGKINIKQATVTTLLSGSGTYTPPVGCVRLRLRMIGGGGGGAGGGNGTPIGGAAGNTTFGNWNAPGGNGNAPGNPANGVTSGSYLALIGGSGSYPTEVVNGTGGNGAVSPFGGAGVGVAFGNAGSPAMPNTGSGGAGGGTTSGATPGQGGGAGCYLEGILPAAAYNYTVGAGGGAGGPGAGGLSGGGGGTGVIIVEEFYI